MAEKRHLVRRPAEERIAEIDKKIAAHKANIATLERKKEAILNPKPRQSKAAATKTLIAKAQESGMTIKEIAEKLGIKIDKETAELLGIKFDEE